jgi:hypothetical protein
MEPENKPPVNLYKKLLLISDEMGRIPKTGYNNYHKYAYVTESDAMDKFRSLCVKHDVMVLTSLVGQQRVNSQLTCIEMSYTIVDTTTGENIYCVFPGQGSDPQDKGAPKAMASSYKYFILKQFLVPTGDDPERDEAPAKQATKPQTLTGHAASLVKDESWLDEKGKTLIEGTPSEPKTLYHEKLTAKQRAVYDEICDLLIDLCEANGKDMEDTLEMVSEWRDEKTGKVKKAGARKPGDLSYAIEAKSKNGWSAADFALNNLKKFDKESLKNNLENWRNP